ncbi:glycosyltransferase family 4 protein [Cylindrospermopsis raciborskii G7]|uniref:glycosyltransferase family 4 protein n=1 Tax=Cylindrospermopsis raciborskii TaxID=77022 RepID=UPI003EC092E5
MRVSLYISNQLPEAGGGYTFESQLLEMILKLSTESHHQFVIYTWEQKVIDQILASGLECVSLYRPFKERVKSKITRTSEAIYRKVKHPRSKFEIEDWLQKHILTSLKINRIDIVLSLVPGTLTVNYPYIMPVWDLQHRLQTYFPEVSINGEWENREKSYLNIIRRATYIVTGTNIGKTEIEKFYQVPSERIKVIPFFSPQLIVNTDSQAHDVLRKYNIPHQYLFYPAQFWSHKNHVNLLLAIKILKEKDNLEFPLVLVGSDKGNVSYVKGKVKELNLSKQVYFLGFVPQKDMASLYINAFALTFVSFFGPDNLPPLEAMALNCPVIASKVSGSEEQLGNSALLVNPKEPQEIANAIKSLWHDSTLRQNLIRKGKDRAFQWTARDYVQSLFCLLDQFEPIRRCWQ